VQLTPSGIVIGHASGGPASTFALPTIAASQQSAPTQINADVVATVDGFTFSASAGASTVVIGDQTVSMGGQLVTLSNNDVVSLGPSGLVIQMPGGGVSTMLIPGSTATAPASSSSTTSNGIAAIIASSTSELLFLW
jgi:hypothetical protein